jgi:hypothetical protein
MYGTLGQQANNKNNLQLRSHKFPENSESKKDPNPETKKTQ